MYSRTYPSTRKLVVLSAALAAVVGFTAPLDAQQRTGSGKDRGAPAQKGSARVDPQPSRSAPPAQVRQQPEQRQQPPAGRPQQAQRPAPQERSVQRAVPQQQRPAPPQRPAEVQRQGQTFRGGAVPRGTYQAPRTYTQPRSSYSTYGRPSYQPRRPVFLQPYFSFRPRISLGFGIHIGYSVAYPYRYYDPYGFYNYRVNVLPGYGSPYRYGSSYDPYYSRIGGVSFNIDPSDALVFVDGEFVGYAGDFSYGQMPLTLAAGRHRVDLEANGYLPASFDITVIGGQVIPYQGTLLHARYTR